MKKNNIIIFIFFFLFNYFFLSSSFNILPYKKISLTNYPYINKISSTIPTYIPTTLKSNINNNFIALAEKSTSNINQLLQQSTSFSSVFSQINEKLTNSLGNLPATGLLALFSSSLSYIISTKFKFSPILSLILVGLCFGPYHLNLIKDVHTLEKLGEIGILFFIYEMGLEINQNKINDIKKYYLIGIKQYLLSTLAFFFILKSKFFNFNSLISIIISSCLSLSSSVIAINLLDNQGNKKKLYGKISLIILLLQDIIVVPLLILLEVLLKNIKSSVPIIHDVVSTSVHGHVSEAIGNGEVTESLSTFAINLILKSVGAVSLIFLLNKKIFPKLFEILFNVKEKDLLKQIKELKNSHSTSHSISSPSTNSSSITPTDSISLKNEDKLINKTNENKIQNKIENNEEDDDSHHREETEIEKSLPREKLIVFLLTSVPMLSYFTKSLGLNETFGPFLSGLLINSNGFTYKIEQEIKILKEIFLNFFFLSIGSSINIKFFLSNFFLINKILFLLILVKTIITAFASLSSSNSFISLPEAIHSGLLISQSGEFALVVFAMARNFGKKSFIILFLFLY